MPRLLVIKGADEGKQFELTGPILGVGRDATNADPPARHRGFAPPRRVSPGRGGGYVSSTVGSANGTFVNNHEGQGGPAAGGRPNRYRPDHAGLQHRPGRRRRSRSSDLAETHQHDHPARTSSCPSPIIKTIGETEGSRILAQPDKHVPLAQDRPGQSRHHVRGQPGGQPHPRPGRVARPHPGADLPLHRGRPRLHHAAAPATPACSSRKAACVGGKQRRGRGADSRQPHHHGSRPPRTAGRAGLRRRPRRAFQHGQSIVRFGIREVDLRADEGPARNARRPLSRHAHGDAANSRRKLGGAASSPRTTWPWPSPSPTRRPWPSRRRATTRPWCRPSGWPPSARPSPPCRTTSRTSCKACAAAAKSSRWA